MLGALAAAGGTARATAVFGALLRGAVPPAVPERYYRCPAVLPVLTAVVPLCYFLQVRRPARCRGTAGGTAGGTAVFSLLFLLAVPPAVPERYYRLPAVLPASPAVVPLGEVWTYSEVREAGNGWIQRSSGTTGLSSGSTAA